jgi:mannose-6-phosphate isomerase-like protein (cupin superfamily)
MTEQPTPAGEPVIVPASAGRQLNAFGENVTVKLGGDETRRSLTLWVEVTPPGVGPPPHYHEAEDELFLVQQGRVQFLVKGQWVEPGEGSAVYVPRGNVHAFRNAGDAPSRMWVMTTPSGFETFFARCAAEFARGGPPDMGKIVAISAEHGIHFVQPPP